MDIMNSLLPLLKAISHNQQNLNIDGADTQLINFATDSGMAVYLKYCAQKSVDNLPTDNKNKILAAELTVKIITNTLLKALKEILKSSDQCHDDIILLKGIAHAQSIYPSPWFRIMSDIDILVSEFDSKVLNIILLNLGYVQTSHNPQAYYDEHHHCMPYYNKKNNIWIEVHTHLFSNTTDVKHDKLFHLQNILNSTYPIEKKSYNKNIKQLAPELHLIYTCVHWAEDYNLHKTCIQFTDIILLINNTNMDWNIINKWLNNTASASSVFLALSYLNSANIIQIPQSFFDHCQLKNKNMGLINRTILYKIIDNYLLGKTQYSKRLNENNLKIIWSTLLKPNSSFINLFLVINNLIFPPDNKNKFKAKYTFNRILKLFYTQKND